MTHRSATKRITAEKNAIPWSSEIFDQAPERGWSASRVSYQWSFGTTSD